MGIVPAPFPRYVVKQAPWKPTLADEETWILEGGDSTFTEWCDRKRARA